jgi:hypothetical protein
MPRRINDRLVSWASDLEDETLAQAARTAELPFVAGHVALMPDAHLGLGATVGSVIPTDGAIIPAAVGVDIGCGMIAVETTLRASGLPDDLRGLLGRIERAVPAGVGKGHRGDPPGATWLRDHPNERVTRLGLVGKAASSSGASGRATTSSRCASTRTRWCGWCSTAGRAASATVSRWSTSEPPRVS